jgi:hypothetical protein
MDKHLPVENSVPELLDFLLNCSKFFSLISCIIVYIFSMESLNPHAVIVSSPGVGHLVRDIELGNRLVVDHNFRVTFFVVLEYQATTGESQLIQSAKAQKTPRHSRTTTGGPLWPTPTQ